MMLAVWRKELRDQLRDRRTLLFMFLPMAMIGPLMFFVIFQIVGIQQEKAQHFRLPVLHAERAEALIAYLKSRKVEIEPAPEDYAQKLKDGKLDVVLSITSEYAANFSVGRPAELELIQDSSQARAMPSVRRVERLLEAYGQQVGTLRLMLRGVAPDLLQAVKPVEVDLADNQKRGANLLLFVSMYALLSLLVGATHSSIDMTAGERERASLEPLLLNPLAPWHLLAGKWLTAVCLSLCMGLLFLLSFYLPVRFLPLHQLDIQIVFGLRELLLAALVLVPLAMPVAAIMLTLGLFAKSHKEAQTNAQIVVALLGFSPLLQILYPMKASLGIMPAPVLAQNLLLEAIVRGDSLPWSYFLLAGASSAFCAMLLLALGAWLLTRERIVFGR